MKKQNFIKLFILTSIAAFILPSCSQENYTYKWKVAVVYTNGDKDTLDIQSQKMRNGGKLILPSSAQCLAYTDHSATLEIVACGVRKYEVLKEEKLPLN